MSEPTKIDIETSRNILSVIEQDWYKTAIQRVTARIQSRWQTSKTTQEREECWQLVQALGQLHVELADMASSAADERRAAEKQQQQADPLRRTPARSSYTA